MASIKQPNFFISLLIFFFLIEVTHCTVLVKAGNNIKYNCENNIYYIKIDVLFSEKPKEDIYLFTLNLASPENLNFKCILDYPKSQIYCSRAFSDETDSITRITYLERFGPQAKIAELKIFLIPHRYIEKIGISKVW